MTRDSGVIKTKAIQGQTHPKCKCCQCSGDVSTEAFQSCMRPLIGTAIPGANVGVAGAGVGAIGAGACVADAGLGSLCHTEYLCESQ